MKVGVNAVTIDGTDHVEAVIRSKAGELVYWARSLYPEDPAKRQDAMAALLRGVSEAIAAGKLTLEDVI
jgi:hypothetical protein